MKKIARHKILIVFGLVIVIFAFIFLFLRNLQWRTLTVEITLGETQPQPNAEVQIFEAQSHILVMVGRTDSNGMASFSLPVGTYQVDASYKSYSAQLTPYRGQSLLMLQNNQTLHIPLRGGI